MIQSLDIIIKKFFESGGALVVTSGGKSYLRGIVSAGIVNSNTGNCDNEYTLYTDAARFTPWIDELIETYG
jgi:secreted trypsin-like serine protease